MKPRSDSKLKILPEERQEQIVAWARAPKTQEHPGGLAYAREQLAADGFKVSLSTLSEFVSWYALRQRFALAASRANQVAELLRQRNPDMEPEHVRELAQSVFTLEALEEKDAESYVRMERLRLDRESVETRGRLEREKLKLAGRRVALLEEKMREAKEKLTEVAARGGLTPETLARIEEAAKLL